MAKEIAVEEEVLRKKGVNYKKVIIPPNYLDNYRYQIEIIPESLYKTSLAKMQAMVMEKLEGIAKLFPQVFVLNQEEYFEQFCRAYDDSPERYLEKLEQYRKIEERAMATPREGEGVKMPVLPAERR